MNETNDQARPDANSPTWKIRLTSTANGIAWGFLILGGLWATGMLLFYEYLPDILKMLLAIVFAISCVVVFFRFKNRIMAKAVIAAGILVVYLASLLVQPNLDREWRPLHSKIATINIVDDLVTIDNVRLATYQSETDVSIDYQTRQFKIGQLKEVWYFVQLFTEMDFLAHTYLAFGYETENGMQYFGVSVEIRCEPDEIFSPTKGLFKQYEIMYTISDERDSIGYRTHLRKNDRLFMYRCNATEQQVQDMFRDIAARITKLEEKPEFYHTFFNNCTNNIVSHANKVGTDRVASWNPRVIFPGWSARTAFNKRIIGREGETFEELKERSRVDPIARQFKLDENFSTNIRAAWQLEQRLPPNRNEPDSE